MSIKSKILQSKPNNKALLSLSVSKTKTYDSCPYKFKLSYIEKLPKKEREYLIFGKFIHEVLDFFHKRLMNGEIIDLNILMKECFKLAYENWKTKITKEQFDEIKIILSQYLVIMKEKRPNVIGHEKPFYISIEDKILLNGFIDRIQLDDDNVLHVADYKSTKLTSVKYLEKDYFQLLTYAFVMCLEDPYLEKVRTSYIILRDNFRYLTKEFSRGEIMEIEEKFIEYASNISEEKLYRPNVSPLCDYCDYLDLCKDGQEFVELLANKKGKFEKKAFSYGKDAW